MSAQQYNSGSLEKDKGDYYGEGATTVVVTGAVDDPIDGAAEVGGFTKQTKRHLLPRHIQIMGISGAIGTGLFMGSGAALSRAGPLGLVLGYAIYALLILSTYNAMGEMVCHLPVDGSFILYAHAFLGDAWGFALGWLYTINGALTVASEVSAVASLITFWTDSVNGAVYVAIVSTSMVLLNIAGVRIYGEGEFYFSLFKIFLIIGLIAMTFITMVGGNPAHDAFGFRYWKDPGPMNAYLVEGATGHFLGFWSVFVQAAFAYGGPDLLAVAAGEARAPQRVLPSVFKRVIYRLVVFYILGTLCVGVLVPHDDPSLTSGAAGAGSSPFVIGAKRLGIPVLPHIINACLVTSAWSCGIEIFFCATRGLYSLALNRKAPGFLRFTWRGVPTFCVLAIWVVSWIGFMAASNTSYTVFTWLTSIVGSSVLLVFSIFHFTYIRFRRAQKAQGITEEQRGYHVRHQYLYSIISLFCYVVLWLTNGFAVFVGDNWNVTDFLFAYFSFAVFAVPLIGYAVYKRTWLVPLAEVQLMAGKTEEDLDDGWTEPEPKTKGQKFNRWLWG
ncbi:hypothetical protein IAT38_003211 [Cryptococcus sp. DSM 104549]